MVNIHVSQQNMLVNKTKKNDWNIFKKMSEEQVADLCNSYMHKTPINFTGWDPQMRS